MKISTPLENRYKNTLAFLEKHICPGSIILDLGTENAFSKIMQREGYHVKNTMGEDLDHDYHRYLDCTVDVVTAFEIFEHMLAPYNILKDLTARKLIATVPLKLWFTEAYWNEADDRDKHYHEFEQKQFDFLLKKTEWVIIDSKKYAAPDWRNFGIRPFLRHFYPRYYMVYCERK